MHVDSIRNLLCTGVQLPPFPQNKNTLAVFLFCGNGESSRRAFVGIRKPQSDWREAGDQQIRAVRLRRIFHQKNICGQLPQIPFDTHLFL